MKSGEARGKVVLETDSELRTAELAVSLLSLGDGSVHRYAVDPPVELGPVETGVVFKGLKAMLVVRGVQEEDGARAKQMLADLETIGQPNS